MSKITVIGAGNVGATIANDLMIQGIASEIVLVDINKQKAFGEALDIYQGAPFCSPAIVRSGDYPFAFFLAGATESDLGKLLDHANESKPIDELFDGYSSWASSNGASSRDWYKK